MECRAFRSLHVGVVPGPFFVIICSFSTCLVISDHPLPEIHPTALIDSHARLADDVRVGPYCVIEGDVTIGAGTILRSHVTIHGPTVIGQHNHFWPFVAIGFEPQDLKYSGQTAGVRIGDHNRFREGATVHCSTSVDQPTTLGDHNFVMTNAHVGHDSIMGNHVSLVTGAMLGGHVTILDRAFVGGGGAIHQFCRVGRLSFTGGGGASISKDLPPYCMADYKNAVTGVNLVGMRRAGIDRLSIDSFRKAFKAFFTAGHTVPNALLYARE